MYHVSMDSYQIFCGKELEPVYWFGREGGVSGVTKEFWEKTT